MFDNKIHRIVYGNGMITDEGIQLINQYIFERYSVYLPVNWSYNCVIPKGEYCGSFVKRVRKYMYKNDIKMSDKECAHLGSMVGRYSNATTEYMFRLTMDDWNKGDFNDDGSCFWGERAYTRPIMKAEGIGAIQFFDLEDTDGNLYKNDSDLSDRGIARAWVAPIDGEIVVFNAYGLTLQKIARIFAQFLGKTYKSVHLSNDDIDNENDELMYINQSLGYVIYSNESNRLEDEKICLNIPFQKYMHRCKCNTLILKEEKYCDECIYKYKKCHHCNIECNVNEMMPHSGVSIDPPTTFTTTLIAEPVVYYCVDCYMKVFPL
jgi:hypothetical protein